MIDRLAKAAEEAAEYRPGGEFTEPRVDNWPEVVRVREMALAVDEEITEHVPSRKTEVRVWARSQVIDTILEEE